jgi:hypothetical protein
MRNKIKILMGLLAVFIQIKITAQNLTPTVTATAGGYSTGGGSSLSWTIGETFITTLQNGNNVLTQGFQQPELLLTTGSISGSPFCAGDEVSIPFSASGFTNSNNVFTMQLSNAAGNFSDFVNFGTLNSTTSGTITGTIPSTQILQ